MDEKEMMKYMSAMIMLAVMGSVMSSLFQPAEEPEEPPDDSTASLSIEIYDSVGNVIPAEVTPADLPSGQLQEGQTYNAVITVGNASTKGGTPWQAVLDLYFYVASAGVFLAGPQTLQYAYPAGGQKSWTVGFTIPLGLGGIPVVVYGKVLAPDGSILAEGTATRETGTLEIEYGGWIGIV